MIALFGSKCSYFNLYRLGSLSGDKRDEEKKPTIFFLFCFIFWAHHTQIPSRMHFNSTLGTICQIGLFELLKVQPRFKWAKCVHWSLKTHKSENRTIIRTFFSPIQIMFCTNQLIKYLFFFIKKKKRRRKTTTKFVYPILNLYPTHTQNYSHTVVCWLLTHFSYSVAVLCLFEHKIDYQCEIFQNGCYFIYENIFNVIISSYENFPNRRMKIKKKKKKIRKLNVVWNN